MRYHFRFLILLSALYVGNVLCAASVATHVTFGAQVANGIAGTALPALPVLVEDVSGNLVTSNASINLTSIPAGVNVTVQAVNGVATFNGLLFAAPGNYYLLATSTGLGSSTSNVFSILPASANPPTVTIESPTAGSAASGILTISGWAIDNASTVGTAIASVTIAVDGVVLGPAAYGISRPDVCATYPGRPGCPNVGFGLVIDTSTLTIGSHTITVSAADSDATPDVGIASVNVSVVSGSTVNYYEIVNRNSGLALDVTGVSTADGAVIQQWVYVGGDNQKWRLISVGNGYWEILSRNSSKVLDVTGVSTANGAVIQQWDYLGGANQQWQIVPIDMAGDFEIVSRNSGKVLDVTGSSTAPGAVIQQYSYLGNANQQWQLVALPDALVQYYEIVSKNSSRVLDVTGMSVSNGALLQQFDYLGGNNQKWQISAVDSTYSKIINKNSGKVLDVQGVSLSNGALVQQWDYLGGANQQWQIVAVDSTNTYFLIINKNSGRVLDVRGQSQADGALVQQWDYLGGANQEWQLVPVN